MVRVRTGKRTQAIIVRSSCFGCLATLQQRHFESKRELSDGNVGGRWAHRGFCYHFDRLKYFFASFLEFLGRREVCAVPQGVAIDFSFFLTKKQREFCWVCRAPIVYATIFAPIVSLHCVHRMYRPWVRIGVSGRSSQWLTTYSGRMSPVRLTPATTFATIVIATRVVATVGVLKSIAAPDTMSD